MNRSHEVAKSVVFFSVGHSNKDFFCQRYPDDIFLVFTVNGDSAVFPSSRYLDSFRHREFPAERENNRPGRHHIFGSLFMESEDSFNRKLLIRLNIPASLAQMSHGLNLFRCNGFFLMPLADNARHEADEPDERRHDPDQSF